MIGIAWRGDPRLRSISHKGTTMDINLALQCACLAFICFVIAIMFLKRYRWRRNKRANRKNLAPYPSTAALGLALLSLQTLAQPDLHHALEQRQTEAADEEQNGDPDDPFAQLNRQLKRIRNGQPVNTLKVPIGKRT
ncbi:MAG: hypothetical protein ABSA39_12925 [Edaphobacter sp.]